MLIRKLLIVAVTIVTIGGSAAAIYASVDTRETDDSASEVSANDVDSVGEPAGSLADTLLQFAPTTPVRPLRSDSGQKIASPSQP